MTQKGIVVEAIEKLREQSSESDCLVDANPTLQYALRVLQVNTESPMSAKHT